MKKILTMAAVLGLTGCTSFSMSNSPLQAEAVAPFSLRAPAAVCFDLGQQPDDFDVQTKQALLASGVIVEDSHCTRTLTIKSQYSRHEGYSWIVATLTFGIVPKVIDINLTTNIRLTNEDGSHHDYQYGARMNGYLGWFASAMGGSYADSRREFGAIVGSHFLNDANRDNAL